MADPMDATQGSNDGQASDVLGEGDAGPGVDAGLVGDVGLGVDAEDADTSSGLNTLKRLGLARPFSEVGPWNTPFRGTEAWFDSPTLRQTVAAEGTPGLIRHWYVGEKSVSTWRSTNADPVWTFVMPSYVYAPFNRQRPASTFTFHCPANMVENQDVDHILVVINTDTGELVEVWQAETTNSPSPDPSGTTTWQKQALPARTVTNRIFGGAVAPGWARSNIVTDPGAGTTVQSGGTNDGTRASNFSWHAGLITGRDMAAPTIDHALVVSLGYVTLDNQNWVAPATAPDNGGHSGPMQMGDRIGVPPGIAMPAGMSTLGQKVFRALQTYGAYVGDFAGSPYPILYIDSRDVLFSDTYPLFAWFFGNPTPDMDKISPLLRIANRNPGR